MADRLAWLRGGDTPCNDVVKSATRAWRLVLLGAPGSGKGTQAELLGSAFGACPLSIGELLRASQTMVSAEGSPQDVLARTLAAHPFARPASAAL